MSRDRMNDLSLNRNQQQFNQNGYRNEQNNSQPAYQLQDRNAPASFYDISNEITAAISTIERNTQELQSFHRRALVEVNSSQAQALTQQIDRIIDATSSIVQKTRSQLKQLDSAPGADPQVKKTQKQSLARKLMAVARSYQKVQQEAKEKYRGQLERQYKIAKPNATRKELDDVVNGNGNVFQQQILSGRVEDQRRVLEDVQSRQNELQKIEQSLVELFNLMQDMQMILENQQESINMIVTNVETATHQIEDGSNQLTSAEGNARSARKKKWILMIIVLVLLLIIGLVIYFQVVKPLIPNKPTAAPGGSPVATPAAAPVAT